MRQPHLKTSSRSTFASLRTALAALLLLGWSALPSAAQSPAAAAPRLLVVCAPGYPGSTAEAQPAMDALAGAVGAAAGWKPGELAGVYFASESAGLARLAAPAATLALVPLNFFLEHRESLELVPLSQAIQQGGETAEPWSLVAGKGLVTGPASLAGFELISLAGNTPRFVRGPALAAWGALPADLKIVFSGALLSGLRRAAAGEKVALLLDRGQTAALATLPSAPQLEIVTRSPPLPVSVLCALGDLPAGSAAEGVRRERSPTWRALQQAQSPRRRAPGAFRSGRCESAGERRRRLCAGAELRCGAWRRRHRLDAILLTGCASSLRTPPPVETLGAGSAAARRNCRRATSPACSIRPDALRPAPRHGRGDSGARLYSPRAPTRAVSKGCSGPSSPAPG
jgi:hypothetical protein